MSRSELHTVSGYLRPYRSPFQPISVVVMERVEKDGPATQVEYITDERGVTLFLVNV